jgi:anaerobic selenocysteine-containing dehydrogenase
MTRTAFRTCPFCEATCGLAIELDDGGAVVSVRGDADDVFSRGFICPKGASFGEYHTDPDRLRAPLKREGDQFVEVGWDQAFDEIAGRLLAIREAHGRDAIAVYQGNPTVHNLGLLTFGQLFLRNLGTRNLYSATSADQLPHMLAAMRMFGHQLLFPVPDIDRSELFVILGANPAVSNGSLMTAPGMRRRLEELRARGGEVVVVDPRRTETARLADRHLFIRPGADALFLAAMIDCMLSEGIADLGHLAEHTGGLDRLARATARFPAERVAAAVGIDAQTIRELARKLATTRRAVLYGRLGVCQQEFGGVASWLVNAVNLVAGNLDRPGGAMFTTPAIDLVKHATALGLTGSFGAFRSRVRGLPEFAGELPVAVLAEEIEAPGDGQIRALITSAGNPVLSIPNGRRLEAALGGLELTVSLDIYLNETTRHADYILPGTSPLERDHYDLGLALVSVRNRARYHGPVFAPPPGAKHDWEICLELGRRLLGRGWLGGVAGSVAARALARLGPRGLLDLGLRFGPYKLRLRDVERAEHGLELGALVPRFPELIHHDDGRIDAAPADLAADLDRLEAWLEAPRDELVLIGRRHLRSNNSWMHNSRRLVKGKDRCTLLVHPADAARLGLETGDRARLESRVGSIEVAVEVSDEIMQGVVSLPHGWGHHRPGIRMAVAAEHAGVSVNDITDEEAVDSLSGNAVLNGLAVTVSAAAASSSVGASA